jgi:hypothetical protein
VVFGMFKPLSFTQAALLAVGVAAATPACAAQGPYYGYQRDARDFERKAYDDGFREGRWRGERDGREGREFRDDRDARAQRGWGDRDEARRFFLDGYRAGYAAGFNRVARSDRGGVFPGARYPYGGGTYTSPAAQIGFRDGVEVGRNDARDRETYDPRRSKRYRNGDHDYDDRFGPKVEYKQLYRDAFLQGYEQGFQQGRRY